MIIAKIKEEDAIREKKQMANSDKLRQQNNEYYKKLGINDEFGSSQTLNKNIQSNSLATTTTTTTKTVVNLESFLDSEMHVNVCITAVAHPFAFWIQILNDSSQKLENLVVEMNKFFQQSNSNYLFVSFCSN
jgi:hypothetical protein